MNNDSVRDRIARIINRVLTDSGRPARELQDEDTLIGTVGLDSLDLAVMVVGLEQELGIDPFRSGARPVQTFGELVQLYENILNQPS
jgi:acyl carrier protein